jgi:glycosyltransferase involved in cell wall biosynthesis
LRSTLGATGRFEILCVDDASGDGTAEVVRRLAAAGPRRLLPPRLRSGRALALATGLHAARAARSC